MTQEHRHDAESDAAAGRSARDAEAAALTSEHRGEVPGRTSTDEERRAESRTVVPPAGGGRR